MKEQGNWWESYSRAIPQGYQEFIEFENAASIISIYNAVVMPGILQTESYAQGVTRQFNSVLSQRLIEDRVKLRMERQWRLFERKPAPKIRILIEESVLLRSVGGTQAQKEQLMHLVQLIESKRISLQITPLQNGKIWPMLGCLPFVLFETPQASLMSMESAATDDHMNSRNPFEINHFHATFDNLCSQSFGREDSLARIQELLAPASARGSRS